MSDPKTYHPDLRHPELSHAIIGAAFEVHNELGPGWNEWDYHRAMLESLQNKGLKAESHLKQKLTHRSHAVDEFELDILVENKIILELKHLCSGFCAQHFIQIINYLKNWGKDLGILINFGMERLSFKRVPYSPKKGTIRLAGKWDDLQGKVKESAESIFSSCGHILDQHGLGYGAESFKKILFQELQYQHQKVRMPEASPTFRSLSFGYRPVDALLLNETVLIRTTAFSDTTAVGLSRLQSAMKHLRLNEGALINFGKSELTLRGVLFS